MLLCYLNMVVPLIFVVCFVVIVLLMTYDHISQFWLIGTPETESPCEFPSRGCSLPVGDRESHGIRGRVPGMVCVPDGRLDHMSEDESVVEKNAERQIWLTLAELEEKALTRYCHFSRFRLNVTPETIIPSEFLPRWPFLPVGDWENHRIKERVPAMVWLPDGRLGHMGENESVAENNTDRLSRSFVEPRQGVLTGSSEAKKKRCRFKRPATKQTMEQKSKDAANRVAPQTERNASGCNWLTFRSIVNSTVSDGNAGKENVRKKSSQSQRQKRRRKLNPMSNSSQTKPMQTDGNEFLDESKRKLTKQVAMDCEMVGIGDGTESMVARVSLVNRYGYCIYDKYVKAREKVSDYRTSISGILPHHLQNGEEFDTVQKEVADILRKRILVGHALKHDLNVLYLSHPRKYLRDTSRFKAFQQLFKGGTPSLKKLTCKLLGREIQTGEHNSVEDARAAMQLYMLYRNKWESEFYSKR